MRLLPVFVLGIFFASAANSAIITKDIEYKDGKTILRGTLAYDDRAKSAQPGVLLFPEWWGHNDYIKKRAAEVASHGYVAFAADMYGPENITTDPAKAQEWSKPFYENRELMRSRAEAALKTLLSQDKVDKSKIAATGFCMGGTVALELARSGADVAGVATFHAGLQFPQALEKDKVKARILVMNGAADPMVSFADRQKFIEEMQTAGADLEFIEYGSAVHAFTNPNADSFKIPGVGYNEKAEKRSFKEFYGFLKEVLGM